MALRLAGSRAGRQRLCVGNATKWLVVALAPGLRCCGRVPLARAEPEMTDIEAVWKALVEQAAQHGHHVLIHGKDGGAACVHIGTGPYSPCGTPAPLSEALLRALMNSSPVRQD